MINAIIIDDEAHCANVLNNDLKLYCPEIKVLDIAHSGLDGIRKIREHSPQVIFLDIEMQDMTGFEMLEIMGPSLQCKVIFTTAYAQFAIRALRINALDYLLKPIDVQELIQAVERIGRSIETDGNNIQQVQHAIANLKLPPEEQKLALPNRNGYDFIAPAEILYCKADGAYTEVYLTNGKTILLSKSLGEIETVLPPSLFVRIHHSCTININHISQFRKSEGASLVMSNGHQLGIARSKKDHLLRRIGLLTK
ncbi:hypothetical protein CA265_12355 [Sphingobacteriaceae bacterium GW460-11-11-14-LB5]|nr:hypothetical protein CA265_12355 [Sphingobacteriaceae bacterium GW460-11-11-14-LB5]